MIEVKKIKELEGKTLTSIEVNNERTEIVFTLEDGKQYRMCNTEDTSNDVSVTVGDIAGDLITLLGSLF